MDTYFNTQEDAKEAVFEAAKENHNTSIVKSSCQCDCGESFCYDLVDKNTRNRLERFIVCGYCKQYN